MDSRLELLGWQKCQQIGGLRGTGAFPAGFALPFRVMAKRRRATASIIPFRQPTIRINVPRSAPVAKRVKHRRRSVAGRAAGALMNSERTGAVIGSFVLGMIDKAGTKVPTIPLLGRAGTLGIGAYYLAKHVRMPMLSHAATGFLCVAAYEMGRDGKVSGDDGVSGIASV